MRLVLLQITNVFFLFLSQDFHELWHSVMSTCLITEAMGYISTWTGDYISALLVSLMALQLALVDRNPF